MEFKNSTFKGLIWIAFGWAMAAIFSTGKWVGAQTSELTSVGEIVTFQVFEPPPGEGEPEHTAGGGSRNDETCLEESKFVALEPDADGEAAENLPIFSVYIPPTSAKAAIVHVEDANRNSLYYDRLPLSGEPGILSLSLPKNVLKIEADSRYYWSLSVMCTERLDPNDPILEGWLEPGDEEIHPNEEI